MKVIVETGGKYGDKYAAVRICLALPEKVFRLHPGLVVLLHHRPCLN